MEPPKDIEDIRLVPLEQDDEQRLQELLLQAQNLVLQDT